MSARDVLILGNFRGASRSALTTATNSLRLDVAEFSDVDEAIAALESQPWKAILVDTTLSGASRFCAEARALRSLFDVPLIALSPRLTDLAFLNGLRWGADDVVALGAAEPLAVRLTALFANQPSVETPSSRGIAVVADPDRRRGDGLGRALHLAGYTVKYASDPVSARYYLSKSDTDLYVLNTELAEPTTLLGSGEQNPDCRTVILAKPTQLSELEQQFHGNRSVVVMSAGGPPENVLFAVNLLFPNEASKRGETRALFGTVVFFRAVGDYRDECGFSYTASPQGIYVRTLAPAPSDKVWVELIPPDGERRVRLVGRVAWSRPFGSPGGEAAPPGFGVRIVDGLGEDLALWSSCLRSLEFRAPATLVPEARFSTPMSRLSSPDDLRPLFVAPPDRQPTPPSEPKGDIETKEPSAPAQVDVDDAATNPSVAAPSSPGAASSADSAPRSPDAAASTDSPQAATPSLTGATSPPGSNAKLKAPTSLPISRLRGAANQVSTRPSLRLSVPGPAGTRRESLLRSGKLSRHPGEEPHPPEPAPVPNRPGRGQTVLGLGLLKRDGSVRDTTAPDTASPDTEATETVANDSATTRTAATDTTADDGSTLETATDVVASESATAGTTATDAAVASGATLSTTSTDTVAAPNPAATGERPIRAALFPAKPEQPLEQKEEVDRRSLDPYIVSPVTGRTLNYGSDTPAPMADRPTFPPHSWDDDTVRTSLIDDISDRPTLTDRLNAPQTSSAAFTLDRSGEREPFVAPGTGERTSRTSLSDLLESLPPDALESDAPEPRPERVPFIRRDPVARTYIGEAPPSAGAVQTDKNWVGLDDGSEDLFTAAERELESATRASVPPGGTLPGFATAAGGGVSRPSLASETGPDTDPEAPPTTPDSRPPSERSSGEYSPFEAEPLTPLPPTRELSPLAATQTLTAVAPKPKRSAWWAIALLLCGSLAVVGFARKALLRGTRAVDVATAPKQVNAPDASAAALAVPSMEAPAVTAALDLPSASQALPPAVAASSGSNDVAQRSPDSVTSPLPLVATSVVEPSVSQAATISTSDPTSASALTQQAVRAPAETQPTTHGPEPSAPAVARATSLPPKDPRDLPAKNAWLYVRSDIDTRVFVHGVDSGATNSWIETPCGTRFVRLGRSAGDWLGPGFATVIRCRNTNIVEGASQ